MGPLRFAAFATPLLFAASMHAAAEDEELKGLREIRIVIEPLGHDARYCGVTETGIEASARFILQQTKLKITRQTVAAYIYYQFTIIKVGASSCAFSHSTSLQLYGVLQTEFGKTRNVYSVWNSNGIQFGPRSATPRTVEEVVESETKRFVSEWSKQNN